MSSIATMLAKPNGGLIGNTLALTTVGETDGGSREITPSLPYGDAPKPVGKRRGVTGTPPTILTCRAFFHRSIPLMRREVNPAKKGDPPEIPKRKPPI